MRGLTTMQRENKGLLAGKDPEYYDLFRSPRNCQPKQSRRTPKRKLDEKGCESSSKHRPRTPSGQVINTSVSILKGLIESQSKRENFVAQINEKFCALTNNSQLPTPNMIKEKTNNTIKGCDGQDQVLSDSSPGEKRDESDTNLASVLFQSGSNEVIAEAISRENINTSDEIEDDAKPNIPSMDVRTVVKMLEDLKIDMKQHLSTETKKQHPVYARKAELLENQYTTLTSQVNVCEARERMMIDTMAGIAEKIKELQEKLEIQDINLNKRAIILSGFEADEKKKIARMQLEDFLQNKVQVEVVIEEFYYIGSSSPREIVLILLSANHKRHIFQNKNNKVLLTPRGVTCTFEIS